MASETCLLICSLSLMGLTVILYGIGFGTPYWMESFDGINSNFLRIGLWQVCFSQSGFAFDDSKYGRKGTVYRGCYWIFADEFRHLRDWISPPWFQAVQSFAIIAMLFLLLATLLVVLRLIGLCVHSVHRTVAWISSAMSFLSAFSTMILVILFGLKSGSDSHWIPSRNYNHLSWSFGLVGGSSLFLTFAATFLALGAMMGKNSPSKSKPIGSGSVIKAKY